MIFFESVISILTSLSLLTPTTSPTSSLYYLISLNSYCSIRFSNQPSSSLPLYSLSMMDADATRGLLYRVLFGYSSAIMHDFLFAFKTWFYFYGSISNVYLNDLQSSKSTHKIFKFGNIFFNFTCFLYFL